MGSCTASDVLKCCSNSSHASRLHPIQFVILFCLIIRKNLTARFFILPRRDMIDLVGARDGRDGLFDGISSFQQLAVTFTFLVDWCLGRSVNTTINLGLNVGCYRLLAERRRGLFLIVLCIDAVYFCCW